MLAGRGLLAGGASGSYKKLPLTTVTYDRYCSFFLQYFYIHFPFDIKNLQVRTKNGMFAVWFCF